MEKPEIDIDGGVATIETRFATATIELDERNIDRAEDELFAHQNVPNGGWWEVAFEQIAEAMDGTAGEL